MPKKHEEAQTLISWKLIIGMSMGLIILCAIIVGSYILSVTNDGSTSAQTFALLQNARRMTASLFSQRLFGTRTAPHVPQPVEEQLVETPQPDIKEEGNTGARPLALPIE